MPTDDDRFLRFDSVFMAEGTVPAAVVAAVMAGRPVEGISPTPLTAGPLAGFILEGGDHAVALVTRLPARVVVCDGRADADRPVFGIYVLTGSVSRTEIAALKAEGSGHVVDFFGTVKTHFAENGRPLKTVTSGRLDRALVNGRAILTQPAGRMDDGLSVFEVTEFLVGGNQFEAHAA